MFIIPSIQNIDIDPDGKRIIIKNNNEKKVDRIDPITYIKNGDEILGVEMHIKHLDVTNALEKYIHTIPMDESCVYSEEWLKLNNFPIKLLPYIGRFKGRKDRFKTDYFLAPFSDIYFMFLVSKYNIKEASEEEKQKLTYIPGVPFDRYDLFNIRNIINDEKLTIDQKQIFVDLLSKCSISVSADYSLKKLEELLNIESTEARQIDYNKIKNIISSSVENEKVLKELNSFKKENSKQKVK